MRIIDKQKKKLKIMQKLNNHKNNIVAGVIAGLGLVYYFVTPFNLIVGLVAISSTLVVSLVCGLDVISNDEKHNRRIDAIKGHVDALQNATQETVVEISKQLEEVTNSTPDNKRDKEKRKSLIRTLIERKKLVTLALEEEGKLLENSYEEENSLSA